MAELDILPAVANKFGLNFWQQDAAAAEFDPAQYDLLIIPHFSFWAIIGVLTHMSAIIIIFPSQIVANGGKYWHTLENIGK